MVFNLRKERGIKMALAAKSRPGKGNVSIREFLKSAKTGRSGVKYSAEAGTKHWFFVPQQTLTSIDEQGNEFTENVTFSEMHWVHEWRDSQKHFNAALCLYSERGSVCPFCKRVKDAWDVYKDRYERMYDACIARGMTKEQAEFYMRGDKSSKTNQVKGAYTALMDERKMREAKAYMYMLIALFELDANNKPVLDNGLPRYELKVMRMTQNRVEDLIKQLEATQADIERQEIMIDYPNYDDMTFVVGQSTTSIVFPNVRITAQYPALVDKIEEEAKQFQWDGLESSFQELTEYNSEAAEEICTKQFKLWDEHVQKLVTNKSDRYLEYSADVENVPALNMGQQGIIQTQPNDVQQIGVAGYTNIPAPNGAVQAGQQPVQQSVQQPVQQSVQQPVQQNATTQQLQI